MVVDNFQIQHVVVLDCNIYLRVAELLEGDYSLSAIRGKLRSATKRGPGHDAASVILACYGGRLGQSESLAVFTSEHIVKTTKYIAQRPGGLGLGLSESESDRLVEKLITAIRENTHGRHYGERFYSVSNNPPLDYEDGRVYGLCAKLAGEYTLSEIWCVTLDRKFIRESKNLSHVGKVRVVHPAEFMSFVRSKSTPNMRR